MGDGPKIKTQKVGGLLTIDTSDFRDFSRGLRKARGGRMATDFKKALRRGAEIVAEQARANASWSHEIPSQITVGGYGATTWVDVTNSGRDSGSGRVAIEFELGNKSYKGRRYGVFKHPVFNSKNAKAFTGKGDRVYYESRTQQYGASYRHSPGKRYGTGVGWSEQRLRPYLKPAFESRHEEVLETVRAALIDSLRNL